MFHYHILFWIRTYFPVDTGICHLYAGIRYTALGGGHEDILLASSSGIIVVISLGYIITNMPGQHV